MSEYSFVIPFPGGSQADAEKGHGFHAILRLAPAAGSTGFPTDRTCRGRRLAVFTHGLLSHKNGIFFKPLASLLDMDSLRWDMSGEGNTPGTWHAGHYDDAADELFHVVNYMHQRFGYVVDLMIGHSKGCAVQATYISRYCTPWPMRQHRPPSRMIFVSGRVFMSRIRRLDAKFQPDFDKQGYSSLSLTVRGQKVEFKLYPEDHESQCSFPAHAHYANLPNHIQCYIAHGTLDNVVPVIDAGEMANIFTAQPGRPAGSVHVNLIEQGDHNLKGDALQVFLDGVRLWLEQTSSTPALLGNRMLISNPTNGERGVFIVVEGLDRSGKSTQVDRVVQTLGPRARLVKFPERTTPIGSMIHSYLKNQTDACDQTVHLLFSANRWELLSSIVQSLRDGQHVICDRYIFSGMAYTHAKGLDLAWCTAPDVGLPVPDLTLFLDLDESTATKRAAYGEERYERRAFQRLVRHAFENVEQLMLQSGARWERLDASGTLDDVWQAVHAQVQEVVSAPRSASLFSLDFRSAALALGTPLHTSEKATL